MKKIALLTLAAGLFSTAALAQTTFGIKAGIQSSSLAFHVDQDETDATIEGPRVGFLIGGTADIPLSTNWSFQPNLIFALKRGTSLLALNGKSNMFTVDIPLNVLYRHNGFFIGAGPNFSYGLSGKIQPFEDGEEDFDLYDDVPGEDYSFFKRFEIGVNSLIGYEFPSGFTLSANFTPGISDILDFEQEGVSARTKMFGINFGYVFGKNAAPKKK